MKLKMKLLLSLPILVAFTSVAAQDANCNFAQQVQAGLTYYPSSPGYPGSYPGSVTCRWIATCPSGYNCRLTCNVEMPRGKKKGNLTMTSGKDVEKHLSQEDSVEAKRRKPSKKSPCTDRLLVSKSGDPQLVAADTYCGTGTFDVVSLRQTLSFGLITSAFTSGGRFTCKLVAQAATSPEQTCRCGYRKQNRIVGGVETSVNEFPMMAALVDVQIVQIKCGCVIITNRFVLSAAHCVVRQTVDNIAVVVGEHDVSTGDSPATAAYRAIKFNIHPKFTESNYDYDISLVQTDRTILFSDLVGPVCLPFKFTDTELAGNPVILLGWGTLFPGGPTSNVLRKTEVNIVSQSTCQRNISTLTPRQVCTYAPGKDACQDDSGGPALYSDPFTGLLFNLGIISFGKYCASNQPGINTRVTSFLDWIVANTDEFQYCVK